MIKEITKVLRELGSSMSDMSKELDEDFKRQDSKRANREKINKENLDKIWGKKD